MRQSKLAIPVLLLALVFAQALTLAAQDKDADKPFTGTLSFGYRAVDQSGAADMYRQHVNLDKGVRLFNFDLTYTPSNGLKAIFDRMDVHAINLGGDPYESFALNLQKFGTYTLRYEHRKSTYFYANDDETGAGRLFDPARYNFDRVSDSGALNVTLSKALGVFVNFNHYTKSGDSAASYDVDSALLDTDRPVAEKMTEIGLGLDLHADRFGLVFEQRHQDYANTNSSFLSGPFSFGSNASTFRLNARPFDSLILRGTAQWSKLDSKVTTLDGGGAGATGAGAFTRKIGLYDFDLTWMLTNRLALVGEVRYSTFGQNGNLDSTTDESGATDFGFNTLGIEGGLQYQLFSRFTLTGGYRYEKRTFTNAAGQEQVAEEGGETESAGEALETVTFADSTVRKGFYGNLRWDLKSLRLTLDYQRGSYDDPYTMVSPTSTSRFRATLRWTLKGFNAQASYLAARTTNELPGGVNFRVIYVDDSYSDIWKSSNDQFTLRLGYSTAKFALSAGYALIDFKTDSTRLVAYNPYWTGPAGTYTWAINYDGKSTVLDATASLNLDAAWKLGAVVNSYDASGFWPLRRTMLKAYVEYTFMGGFVSQLSYRYYDFKEKDTRLIIHNNYTAGILEISFGYRWQ